LNRDGKQFAGGIRHRRSIGARLTSPRRWLRPVPPAFQRFQLGHLLAQQCQFFQQSSFGLPRISHIGLLQKPDSRMWMSLVVPYLRNRQQLGCFEEDLF
jgi:hypothetical protein